MEVNLTVSDYNASKINRLIDSIEGSSKVRPLTFDQIKEYCEKAEKAAPIPKNALTGTEIYVDVNAGKVGTAYNGSPMSTKFRAVKTPTGWKVLEIVRDYYTKKPVMGTIKFSETAQARILDIYNKLE